MMIVFFLKMVYSGILSLDVFFKKHNNHSIIKAELLLSIS